MTIEIRNQPECVCLLRSNVLSVMRVSEKSVETTRRGGYDEGFK